MQREAVSYLLLNMMVTPSPIYHLHLGIVGNGHQKTKALHIKEMPATNGPPLISHLHLGYLGMVTMAKHQTQSFEMSNNLKHHNNL